MTAPTTSLSPAKTFAATLAQWLGVALLVALAEASFGWATGRPTFLFAYKHGAFALLRQFAKRLEINAARFDPEVFVPDAAGTTAYFGEALFAYGGLALLAGLCAGLVHAAISKLRAPGWIALHSGLATLVFGGAALGLRQLQGRGGHATRHLAASNAEVLAYFALAGALAVAAAALAFRLVRAEKLLPAAIAVCAVGLLTLALAATLRHPPLAEDLGVTAADHTAPSECSEPKNVILISLDTLRADHMSLYGYERETVPILEQLAARGAVFENCMSAAPWTVPSHSSMLTSTYASEHGARNNDLRLAGSPPTLTRILKSHGYRTTASVSALNASSKYGLDQDFDVFDEPPRGRARIPGNRVTDILLDRLERIKDKPFFAFGHFFDAHPGFDPFPKYDDLWGDHFPTEVTKFENLERYAGADLDMDPEDLEDLLNVYDGRIRFMDDQVGRILQFLDDNGLTDKTIVAVVSDHGEAWEENGYQGHRYYLHRDVIRVPLLIAYPGAPEGGIRVATQVRTIDLAPTLLQLAGCGSAPTFRGEALIPQIEAGTLTDLPAFAETTEYLESRMISEGGLKLILDPYQQTIELYDTAADPRESNNLASARPADVDRLRARLYEIERMLRARREVHQRAGGTTVGLDEDERKALRSLGYLD